MTHSPTPPPWVLVCGGFHRYGGMDRANYALTETLLAEGCEVFLVGHHIAPELLANPSVHATVVGRPLGVLMAEGALRREGLRVAKHVTHRWHDARVVANGGNCPWPDINWVHMVHAYWPRFDSEAPAWFRAKSRIDKQKARRDELAAFRKAKLVIANSELTRRELVKLGVDPQKIRTIYLGCEPDWVPPSAEKRAQARQSFHLPEEKLIVSFAGALGYDRRKGFDTMLAAWNEANLTDAILVAAGAGRGFEHWQNEVAKLGLHDRVCLLGFTDRAGDLYDASDLFVSPVRYEPFGLNVLEAICRGVPTIVTKTAGSAEVYPPELSKYLLDNPEDASALSTMLVNWSRGIETARTDFSDLSARLRSYTMPEMAEKIIEAAESTA
jgi:glycosyltransferase involved in cell wall biosynthesis